MEWTSPQVEKQSFITLSVAEKLEIFEEAEERYLAYVFLKQSAKTSEKLRTSISDNYNIGDKKYPTTQQETFHYLDKHSKSFVHAPTNPEDSSFAQRGGDTFDKKFWKNKEFLNCGKKGHPSTHCTSENKKDKDSDNDSKSSQTSQMEKMKKNTMKTKKWFATLQTQFEKLEGDASSDITGSGDESRSSFLQVSEQCFAQAVGSELQKQLSLHNKSNSDNKLQLRNVMLLEKHSTMDLICNNKFTSKIKKSREKLRVQSNGGRGFTEIWKKRFLKRFFLK